MRRLISRPLGVFSAVALVALAAGCGELAGTEYRGPPLASLRGQLTAEQDMVTGGDVRLAVAWYPNAATDERGLSKPAAIVTEDVEEQGAFPFNYAFHFYAPPPPEALGDFTSVGGPRNAAVGVLLVYEDRNQNGTLDTFSELSKAPDRVLGTSWELLANRGASIVYVDGTPEGASAESPWKDLQAGFNLVTGDGVRPLDTSVRVNLTGAQELALFVCEELFSPLTIGFDGPCGFSPPLDIVYLGGVVRLVDGVASAEITVTDNDAQPLEAEVTIDGQVIPSSGLGDHRLTDDTGALVSPGGSHVVRALVRGKPHAVTIRMPGEFSVLTPASGATLSSGAPVELSWTESAHAIRYYALLGSVSGDTFFDYETLARSFTSDPVQHSGPAKAGVRAVWEASGASTLRTELTRRVNVTFVP